MYILKKGTFFRMLITPIKEDYTDYKKENKK